MRIFRSSESLEVSAHIDGPKSSLPSALTLKAVREQKHSVGHHAKQVQDFLLDDLRIIGAT